MKLRAVMVVIVALGSASAHAASDAETTRAKRFFRAGSIAYERGRFLESARAFEEAYRSVKAPAIAFSMAQAYRRQFFVDRDSVKLQRAITLFETYVEASPSGRRKPEAVDQIQSLESIRAQVITPEPPPPPPAALATELLVYAEIEGARVTVDDGALEDAPLLVAVTPGPHVVRAEAPGHIPRSTKVVAIAERMTPIPIELEEQPARITVTTDDGAELFVDGDLAGTAPLATPLALPSGEHRIDVRQSGRHLASETLTVVPNEALTIELALETTTRRQLAHVFLGTSAALIGVGIGTTIGAVVEERAALERTALRGTENITGEDLTDFNGDVRDRNTFRTISVAVFSTAVVAGIVGGILYLFDTPAVPPNRPARTGRPSTPATGFEF